jgi:hypothetical protein
MANSEIERVFRDLTKDLETDSQTRRFDGKELFLQRDPAHALREYIVARTVRLVEAMPKTWSFKQVRSVVAAEMLEIIESGDTQVSVGDTLVIEGVGVVLEPKGMEEYGGEVLEPDEMLVGQLIGGAYGRYATIDAATREAVIAGTAENVDTIPAIGPMLLLGGAALAVSNNGGEPHRSFNRVYVPLAAPEFDFYKGV